MKDPGPADDHYDQFERLIEAVLAVAYGIRELTDLLEVYLSPRDRP